MSQASWRAVMRGLGRHFGSDASLDAAKAGEIGTFLGQCGLARQIRHVRQPGPAAAAHHRRRLVPAQTSIVRRIGELHAAPVSFDAADGGGLRASVLFPPA